MTLNQRSERVRFADFEVDLASGEIFRRGKRLEVQNKPFRILEVLLFSGGELVGRERLIAAVWPDVHVGQRSINTAVHKLRIALADDASQPRLIETVGSRGYRLLPPVKFLSRKEPDATPPARLRLAALPFLNLGSPEDEFFSAGLTDQMIAQLGRIHRSLSVVTPFAVMRNNGAAKALTSMVRNVNAEYVLTGSVLRRKGVFRVIAKLIRAKDKICLWSESYICDKSDFLRVQEQVTGQIASAIVQVLPLAPQVSFDLEQRQDVHEKRLAPRSSAGSSIVQ